MNLTPLIAALVAAFLPAACKKKTETTAPETRPVSLADAAPRLDADSHERFSNSPHPRFVAGTPKEWTVVPPTELRLLNYRFGPSGKGEVWVSASAGTVLDNANRWLRQFGKPPLDEAALKALPTAPLLGTTGVVVRAEGEYNPGMGPPPRPDCGLAGIIAEVNGEIVTVKMVADAAEARLGFPALEMLAASLRKSD